jgi:hypothetical protein
MSSTQSFLVAVCLNVTKLLILVLLLSLCVPTAGLAQYNQAPNFSLTPASIIQGACYTIRVPNWAGAVMNVGYTTAWTGQQYIYGWPSLDTNGNALICSDSSTHLGTYTYNYASNNYYSQWWPVNASITVNSYAPPQQPTSLSFNPTSGYAGIDCYITTAGNAGNMTIDLYYTFNSVYQPVTSLAMNGSGQWRYCIDHHDQVGNYIFYQMKNHLASSWVTVNPPAAFLVRAPQPTWLAISPDTIVQGNSYQILVGNGAATTLDLQYKLNDGPIQTITSWPTIVPTDGNYGYNGSASGYANIATASDTALGKYVLTAVKNTLNATWLQTNASLTICPSAAPTISSISPNLMPQGSSATVTIAGANLCAVTLQSLSNPGLSFSNIVWNYPFTSATATANTTSSASTGQAQIRLTTPAGNVTAQITVSPPAALSKEYIYFGDRVISTVSP